MSFAEDFFEAIVVVEIGVVGALVAVFADGGGYIALEVFGFLGGAGV